MKVNNFKKKRQSNIELLRIVLIIMIIIHHILLNCFGIKSLIHNNFNENYLNALILNSFLVPAVNVFFLISGYFHIKFNHKNLFRIIFLVYFIYFFIYLLFLIFMPGNVNLHNINFKDMIFPIGDYWYILVYIILYLLSPYMNIFLQNVKTNDQKNLLFILTLLFCIYSFFVSNPVVSVNRGYSIYFAIYLYFIGDFLNKNILKFSKNSYIYLLYYIFISALVSISVIFTVNIKDFGLTWKIFGYNNPLLVLSSVMLFLFFLKLKINSAILQKISKLSKYTLAIYVSHSTYLLSKYIFKTISNNRYYGIEEFVFLVLSIFFIYIIGVTFGIVYDFIFKLFDKFF